MIRKQIDDGREAKERLDAAEAEYQRALLARRDRRRSHPRRGPRRGPGDHRGAARQRAQDEADRVAVREHGRLEAERQQIVAQLRTEVGQIAVDLAGRIVGESLDDEARQRRMVERFIADLEAGGEPVAAG